MASLQLGHIVDMKVVMYYHDSQNWIQNQGPPPQKSTVTSHQWKFRNCNNTNADARMFTLPQFTSVTKAQ